MDLIFHTMNTSKLFNGMSSMAMHIGGRYLSAEIPQNVEKTFNKPFFRRLFIFFIIYLAFRDVKWAILITLLFILTFNYILNEDSQVFIGKIFGYGPEKKEDNNPNTFTLEELEKAKRIIKIYNENLEKQKVEMR